MVRMLPFIHKGAGDTSYNVAVQNLDTGRMRILSSSPFEDAPDVSAKWTYADLLCPGWRSRHVGDYFC